MKDSMETPLGLLDRLRNTGSEADWNIFASIYYPLVLQWCKRSGCPEGETMDMVQEVFLDVHQNIVDFKRRRRGSFRTWLRRILLSKLSRLRKRRFPELIEFEELQECIAIYNSGACDKIRYEEILAKACEKVRPEFSEDSWNAFWQTQFVGTDMVEVGGALGLTPNSVYIARCRITRRMKECLIDLLC
jgi:RNA polymerase sigma-70 factor (ECF subfamily)